jgi:DNA-binding protein H-NS
MALKTMSVPKLRELREKVDAMISAKVSERRRELESELSELARHDGKGRGRRGASLLGRTVAPKYRNPENPAETWSGRGLPPRWMAAEIKAGKKKDDFLIEGPARASAARTPKKTRKVRKAKQ